MRAVSSASSIAVTPSDAAIGDARPALSIAPPDTTGSITAPALSDIGVAPPDLRAVRSPSWDQELRRNVSIQSKLRVDAGDRVFFATGSAELGSRARSALAAQAKWLMRWREFEAAIEGHADEPGSEQENIVLSEQRAEAVRDRLIQEGVEPSRIAVVPLGRSIPSPRAPMPTAARRTAAPLPWCLPPARASAWAWWTAARRAPPRRPCKCRRPRLSYPRRRLKSPAPGPCRVDKRCPRCWLGCRNDVVAAVAGCAEAGALRIVPHAVRTASCKRQTGLTAQVVHCSSIAPPFRSSAAPAWPACSPRRQSPPSPCGSPRPTRRRRSRRRRLRRPSGHPIPV